jgi:hypothetical protein
MAMSPLGAHGPHRSPAAMHARVTRAGRGIVEGVVGTRRGGASRRMTTVHSRQQFVLSVRLFSTQRCPSPHSRSHRHVAATHVSACRQIAVSLPICLRQTPIFPLPAQGPHAAPGDMQPWNVIAPPDGASVVDVVARRMDEVVTCIVDEVAAAAIRRSAAAPVHSWQQFVCCVSAFCTQCCPGPQSRSHRHDELRHEPGHVQMALV